MGLTAEDYAMLAIPSVYVAAVWDYGFYDWQAEVVDPLLFEGNRSVASTNNESGKTSEIITKAAIWYMDTFPGSVVVTTSASARQIEQQLYANIRACVASMPNGENWEVRSGNKYWVKAPNGSNMFSFRTTEAGRAEGYHVPALHDSIHEGKELDEDMVDLVAALEDEYGFKLEDKTRLLIVIDEAKSVDLSIFRAFERCRATNWLVLSTPPEDPVGPFFDCFGVWAEKFRCVHTGRLNIRGGFEKYGLITYKDCPHLTKNRVSMRQIAQDIEILGRQDAFVRSMHFGEFSAVGQNMVFNMPMVDRVMTPGEVPHLGTMRDLAIDYSGGKDKQVMGLLAGNEVRFIGEWHEEDGTILADRIEAKLTEIRWPKNKPFKGDDGGLGEIVNDILERRGWTVDRYKFGGKAKSKQYLNRRAESCFKAARHVALAEVILPQDPELKKELGWHKYRTDENRKRRIIPKDEMPSSPNKVDVVMMLLDEFEPDTATDNRDEVDRFIDTMMNGEGEDYDPFDDEGMLFG